MRGGDACEGRPARGGLPCIWVARCDCVRATSCVLVWRMRACVATCDQLLPCADRRAANGVDAASVPARAAVRMTARRCALKCARFADLPMSHVGEAESARNRRVSSCRSLVRRITCRAAAQETRARLLCEKMTEIVRKQRNQLRGDPEPPHFRGSPTSLEAISASVSVARQMSLVRT